MKTEFKIEGEFVYGKNELNPEWVILGRADELTNGKSNTVTRKAFICIGCECVYTDEPVATCDCYVHWEYPKGTNLFIEGQITYNKNHD